MTKLHQIVTANLLLAKKIDAHAVKTIRDGRNNHHVKKARGINLEVDFMMIHLSAHTEKVLEMQMVKEEWTEVATGMFNF